MKRLLLIIIGITLSTSVYADEIDGEEIYVPNFKQELKLMTTFKDWEIYQQVNSEKGLCFAVSAPYRTKAFSGVRETPFLAISYKGKDEFTISTTPGFIVDKSSGVIIKTNNRSHLLNIQMPRMAWTYSSVQDKAIIEDMIKDGTALSIRSYTTSDDTALDFYSLLGLKEALLFMEDHCQ